MKIQHIIIDRQKYLVGIVFQHSNTKCFIGHLLPFLNFCVQHDSRNIRYIAKKYLISYFQSAKPSQNNTVTEFWDDEKKKIFDPNDDMPVPYTMNKTGLNINQDLRKYASKNFPRSKLYYSGVYGLGLLVW